MLSPTITKNENVLSESDYLISRTDLENRLVYVNESFARASGYEPIELIGMPYARLIHQDTPSAFTASILQSLRAGRRWEGTLKHRCKDGSAFWSFSVITPSVVGAKTIGYTTIRTKPTEQQMRESIAVFEALRRKPTGKWLVREKWVKGLLSPTSLGPRLLLTHVMPLCTGIGVAELLHYVDFYGFSRQVTLAIGLVSGLVAATLFAFMTRTRIRKELNVVGDLVYRLASGDLSFARRPSAFDEVGVVMNAVDTMRKSLVSIVADVRGAIDAVAETSAGLAERGNGLAARTESQAASLEQTAATLEQMTSAISRTAENATQATHVAEVAKGNGTQGQQIMADVVARMADIQAHASEVKEIVNVIQGIAAQTNILALNAAVEAARAGTSGRGFAVVASEVRALSQRTASSADDIERLVRESLTKVQNGGQAVAESQKTLNEVFASVDRVAALMEEIAGATNEQKIGIEQINASVMQLEGATQQNSSLVEATARDASTLTEQASLLHTAVGIFRV
ncbi:methyl-accepting chemotaxis sensory transducer with Pas/Pac sensor [Burkholderia sp. BT03]|nr:methyl-accepting chemotaxis sensory transducer with Pas/Pac sensor [Burkholderia sp. BT03]SKC60797.1 methyl-accepting chemotaxis sensory transducer with Pas/Pac sensor [Paraburkholderia hospita]